MSAPLELPGGVRAWIHATGEETGGAFVLLTDEAPPGWALPPHRHAAESETIHITGGSSWMEIDGERRELRAGDTVTVPAGTLHSGGTLGDEPLRRVVIFSPAGMEHFFRALAETGSQGEMLALATDHGWSFA